MDNSIDPSLGNPPIKPEHQAQLEAHLTELKKEQNLLFGILSGFTAALVGALGWAAITIALNVQIGFMAIGVGFLVGIAVRFSGKGIDKIFGVVGAIFAFLGCLLGNIFTIIAYAAQVAGMNVFEALLYVDYSLIPQLMQETFSPIDLLFYGIALYEGYRFSFKPFDAYAFMNNLKD